MFDQLFTWQVAIVHHQSSPFAGERQLYLKRLIEEGRSRSTVRNIAQLLVVVVRTGGNSKRERSLFRKSIGSLIRTPGTTARSVLESLEFVAKLSESGVLRLTGKY